MTDQFFKDEKVLTEVWQALEASESNPVAVIIRPASKWTVQQLKGIVEEAGATEVDATDYFVRGVVGAAELEKLIAHKAVDTVWHEKPIEPKWRETVETVKALPVHRLFNVKGERVAWAVLDTGIRGTHKFFQGAPVKRNKTYNFSGGPYRDNVGHGTHVAGIIRKVAPKCTLYDFQVLDGKGRGSSWGIIKAMSRIREINRGARETLIHGANLSLGGPPPIGSYGVGHSPECQEANRLVHSGVVVCVAASNDGYKELLTNESGKVVPYKAFMDIGITDPGNAEEVITVGSSHKTNPHTYGPSYFSSRGPTGDGRAKPDLLAPGEKIKSASHESDTKEAQMSGTSMATPVVSGVVALMLSARREFIGRPQDVKRHLLENCTDLGRDRNFQGAGLVDVLRLLQAV